jgi:hypothetical protein
MRKARIDPAAIRLDQDDVKVLLIERPACACGRVATHTVTLDLRNNGVTVHVEDVCGACKPAYLERLRSSLRR